MYKYMLKRLPMLIPVIIGVTSIVFFILNLSPGDLAAIILGDQASAEALIMKREELGLNDPLLVHYGHCMVNMLHGDLGTSYENNLSVWSQVTKWSPNTVVLVVAGILVATLIGIPMGTISAKKQHSMMDNTAMPLLLVGVAMPNFWFGLLMAILFTLTLGWLPLQGMGEGFTPLTKSLVLPAVTLGTGAAAMTTRMIRSSMLEVIRQDYIDIARAKGVSGRRITTRHMLKNVMIPIIAAVGLQFGTLLGGTMLTEAVFSWPGPGRLMVGSIKLKDTPMVLGSVTLLAITLTMVNLVVDIIYASMDSRIKLQYKRKQVQFIGKKHLIAAEAESDQRPLQGEARRRSKKNRLAMIGMCSILILVIIAIATIIIDVVTGKSIYLNYVVRQDLRERLQGLGLAHPFGLDEFGRDMSLRILWAVRYSLFMGTMAIIILYIFGGLLGAFAGYYGKIVDNIIMRIMDILLAIPSVLLAIATVVALGTSIINVLIATTISYVSTFARTVRASVFTVEDQELIEAARSTGCSDWRIVIKYAVPNPMASIIVQVILGVVGVTLSIAGLSLLGLGIQPPTFEWGAILSNARSYTHDAWHVTIIPGMGIMLTILAPNLMGDGLRDVLDPRLKS